MRKEDGHGNHGHATGPVRSEDELRRMGYEVDDVGVGTILRWVAFMFVFVLGSLGITYGIYLVFVPGSNMQAEVNAQSPLLACSAARPPTRPFCRPRPKQDWKDFTREEDEKVHTYGWVNANRGVVKIPVERAIDLLAERGIPKTAFACSADRSGKRRIERPTRSCHPNGRPARAARSGRRQQHAFRQPRHRHWLVHVWRPIRGIDTMKADMYAKNPPGFAALRGRRRGAFLPCFRSACARANGGRQCDPGRHQGYAHHARSGRGRCAD
jgi:hypothetical protein